MLQDMNMFSLRVLPYLSGVFSSSSRLLTGQRPVSPSLEGVIGQYTEINCHLRVLLWLLCNVSVAIIYRWTHRKWVTQLILDVIMIRNALGENRMKSVFMIFQCFVLECRLLAEWLLNSAGSGHARRCRVHFVCSFLKSCDDRRTVDWVWRRFWQLRRLWHS